MDGLSSPSSLYHRTELSVNILYGHRLSPYTFWPHPINVRLLTETHQATILVMDPDFDGKDCEMTKKLIRLVLVAALVNLFCVISAVAAPTAPSWIDPAEYAIFDGSEAYEGETWQEILLLREYAENGGTLDMPQELDILLTKYHNSGDTGIVFEVGMIMYKFYLNIGGEIGSQPGKYYWLTDSLYRVANGSIRSEFISDENAYLANLWHARLNFCNNFIDDYPVRKEFATLMYLLEQPQFKLEDLLLDTYISYMDPQRRAMIENMIIITVDDKYLASPYYLGAYAYIGKEFPYEYAVAKDGRTMVPIRYIAEPLGMSVSWRQETQTVTLIREDMNISFVLGNNTAIVNGRQVKLDVPAYAENGRTYIPLRFVSEEMGAEVAWDGDKRLVTVTYQPEPEDVLESTNLHQWALPMGAYLSRENSWECRSFGEPLAHVYRIDRISLLHYAPKWYDSRTEFSFPLAQWNIRNRKELIETIGSMSFYGHNAEFQNMVTFIQSLTEDEYKAILANASPTDQYMFPYTMELYEKWGDRGIMCWDLFRMSNLIQWGHTANAFALGEALAMLEPAATRLQENFTSWDEAYENYVDGYLWWSRIDGRDLETFETERGKTYLSMKRGSDGIIFDDSLFNDPVKSVPGVSFWDLLAEIE